MGEVIREPRKIEEEKSNSSAAEAPALSNSEAQHNVLSELGEKIFLDRYAIKDGDKSNLHSGDRVVVCVDPLSGQRELGYVSQVHHGTVDIELADGEVIAVAQDQVTRPLEQHPSQMVQRVAHAVATVEEDRAHWEEEFAWLLEDWRFVPGGRILTAAGTGQELTFYNCYTIPPPKDSRDGIVQTLSHVMEIMSRGGGVGMTISSLRPRGAYVKGVNGRSSGSVSWGALYSFITGLIEQGGSRRGALILLLDVWHPDLLEFLLTKRNNTKLTNANISVAISDDFMQAVKDDAPWDLVFPDTHFPGYNELWDGDMQAWKEAERPLVVHQTLPAREIWKQLVKSAWACAEPGLWFKDRTNAMSNSWYYSPMVGCNPCLTADSLILTDKGPRQIADLVETPFRAVVEGKAYSSSEAGFWCTGTKEVFRLTTKEGFTLRLTSNHQLQKITRQTEKLQETEWVELSSLQPGDRIALVDQRNGRDWQGKGTFEEGWLLGSLVGDGSFNNNLALLNYWGEHRDSMARVALDYLKESVPTRADIQGCNNDEKEKVVVKSRGLAVLAESFGIFPGEKGGLPFLEKSSCAFHRGFLRGFFDANGSVQESQEKGASIRLAPSDLERLRVVQRMLARFGVVSTLHPECRPAGERKLPDGKGGSKLYDCRADHELVISKDNLLFFAERIGFHDPQKQERLQQTLASHSRPTHRERFTATIDAIELDGEEPVYDATVQVVHCFDANGILSHNCGEQPLPAWGVCNLGSLNLPVFLKEKEEDKVEVDWEQLKKAVGHAVRFLDNVIDVTPYFFEENKTQQQSERRIGLGTLGLGEMLVRLKLRYGSEKSLAFLDKLYSFIACEAYLASAALAQEKGAFPRFEAEPYLQSGFMQQMPKEICQAIHQQGMRNVTLLTQPPTGTTGTMLGTSTGIEPFFFWEYHRKSRLGKHLEQVSVYKEWLEAHPDEPLPDYFVTAMDLSPEEHIQVQATIQRWVDAAISKTANLPTEYTVPQVQDLYEKMYELGCKGGTVYRDGSRDEQVLTRSEAEEDEAKEAPSKNQETPKAPKAASPSPPLPATPPPEQTPPSPEPQPKVRPRPYKRYGVTLSKLTPAGTAHITMNNDQEGHPFEVFLEIGKGGSDIKAMAEALGRLMSLVLRLASPLSPTEKIQEIINQIKGIGGAISCGFGKNRVLSLPDAVGQALEEHYFRNESNEEWQHQPLPHPTPPPLAAAGHGNGHGANGNGSQAAELALPLPHEEDNESPSQPDLGAFMDLCPSCGQTSFIRSGGCMHCLECGYSRC